MKQLKAKLKIIFIRLTVLWLPFSLGCLVAIPTALFAIVWAIFHPSSHARNILLAMDKLAASVMGWTGRNTVSAECGVEEKEKRSCFFCKILCRYLNVFDPNHCRDSAIGERLIRRETE